MNTDAPSCRRLDVAPDAFCAGSDFSPTPSVTERCHAELSREFGVATKAKKAGSTLPRTARRLSVALERGYVIDCNPPGVTFACPPPAHWACCIRGLPSRDRAPRAWILHLLNNARSYSKTEKAWVDGFLGESETVQGATAMAVLNHLRSPRAWMYYWDLMSQFTTSAMESIPRPVWPLKDPMPGKQDTVIDRIVAVADVTSIRGWLCEHASVVSWDGSRGLLLTLLSSKLGTPLNVLESVKLLVNHGADPNKRDREQKTALHWLSQIFYWYEPLDAEIGEILLAYGADPAACDSALDTPLAAAVRNGRDRLASLMRAVLLHGDLKRALSAVPASSPRRL